MKTTTCILIVLFSTAFALPFEGRRLFSADDDQDGTDLRTGENVSTIKPNSNEQNDAPDDESKENKSDEKDPMDMAASENMECCKEMGVHEHVHDHHVDNEKKDDDMSGDSMQADESQDSYQTAMMDEATTPQTMDSKEVKTRDTDVSRDLKPPAVDASSWRDTYQNDDEKSAQTTEKTME